MKKNNSKLNLQELSKTNMPKHPKESITRGQYQIKEILLETLSWMVTGMPTNCSRRYRSDWISHQVSCWCPYSFVLWLWAADSSSTTCTTTTLYYCYLPGRVQNVYNNKDGQLINLHVQPQNVHYHYRSQCILRNHEEFDKKIKS